MRITPFLSQASRWSGGSRLECGIGFRAPGEREEHLLELGLAQGDVLDVDAGVLDRPQRVHQHRPPAVDADADPAGRIVDANIAVVEVPQHSGDPGHVIFVPDVYLDDLAAAPALQL